ncbi:GtrA family protein [Pleomorphomonas oryzae]|uniref:GtrA family protein n=1 Tax=Pleomorphomonas oryzae TaxID=261934 RepID=UPI001AEC64E0|nr:GtrA family protein [Pleomorphomonas oryzae]
MGKLTGSIYTPCWIAEMRINITFTNTFGQIVRYGVVGVLNNLLGYLIYLLVTWLWLDPKTVVALMYPIGATTAYFGHARYSFSYSGRASQGIVRYIVAHLIGYVSSIGMLFVFSDCLGFPHQLVQAVSIFVVAGILYILFRYYVFPQRR